MAHSEPSSAALTLPKQHSAAIGGFQRDPILE
jgi:hypothetical protein